MQNIWKNFESDNWFERNKLSFDKKNLSDDPIIKLLDLYKLNPSCVLDIGSSIGYRLNYIKEKYGSKKNIAVEPSKKAVHVGKEKYPDIEFINSTFEESKIESKFDLIIVNFVLHWVYRENIFKFIKKIDDVLTDSGFLIIGDFGTDSFIRRNYTHIESDLFYTWKQSYENMFISSGKYIEVSKLRFNHDLGEITTNFDNSNMGTIVLLKKENNYLEL